jgi:hypothetical protein
MDTRIIEVALGLALVFALASLLVTAIRELWASLWGSRAKILQQALVSFLGNDKAFAAALMKHPLLDSLQRRTLTGTPPPSYVGADMLVTALIASLLKSTGQTARPKTPALFIAQLAQAAPSQLAEGLASLLHGVENDWPGYEARVCAWYDSVTERSVGWFKRKSQVTLLVFGFIVAAAANIDPLVIAPRLWQDGPVREALAAAAEQTGKSFTANQTVTEAVEAGCTGVASEVCTRLGALTQLKDTGLPLGWAAADRARFVMPCADGSGDCWNSSAWRAQLSMLIGWLITAIAASLGAPFWFDALGRVARLRSAGPRPSAADTAGAAPTPPGGTAMSLPMGFAGTAPEVARGAPPEDAADEASVDDLAAAPRAKAGPPGFAGAAPVGAAARKPSGPEWVTAFPGSKEPSACRQPFADHLQAFLDALEQAGANVRVSATLRPPERAYLMHWSWKIARNIVDARNVPAMAGVDIAWVHTNSAGQIDLVKSRSAASQMVTAFGIVAAPALQSRHTEGRAVDMTIGWSGALAIADQDGGLRNITSTPRDGMNPELALCGRTYGVIKAVFAGDPPHWSEDGH